MVSPIPNRLSARHMPDQPAGLDLRGGDDRFNKGLGWYVTFIALALLLFVGIGIFTGVDAIAATGRFLWNALAAVFNVTIRAAASLLASIAKGVGWRRLSRIATAVGGVGLSYAGGVVLSDRRLQQARGWTGRLKLLIATLRQRWLTLPLGAKLAIVVVLIASQIYLHVLLILFPIAFLVPIVRRLWVRAADLVFSRWYRKALGRMHRAAVARLCALPGVRHAIGAMRLTRIRYLYAWRLWKYDSRYRSLDTGERELSFVEPMRLWWRGELDGYVGHPLLGGARRRANSATKP